MKNPVSIHVSENSKTSSEITYLDVAAQSQTMSFSVPDNLQQYVVVVPSKLRLVCLAAFILARCKVNTGNPNAMQSCLSTTHTITLCC